MKKGKVKLILPYVGLPFLEMIFFFANMGRIDAFVLLWLGLILAFGYVAAVMDIKEKKVPNSLILAMIGGWVITILPKLFLDTDMAILLLRDSGLGFLVGGGLFLLVYAVSRKGLGGGDVKFMAATGLYMGMAGVISAMLYGTILAAITGLTLLLLKKIGRKDSLALVPFLYIGIVLTIFFR